jgi:hypothetical protein
MENVNTTSKETQPNVTISMTVALQNNVNADHSAKGHLQARCSKEILADGQQAGVNVSL